MVDTLDLGVDLTARFVPQAVIKTRTKRRVWRAKSLCAGADVVGIGAALGVAALLVGDGGIAQAQRDVPQSYFAVAMLSLPCWLLAFSNLRLYMSRFTADRMEEFRRIVHACVFGAMSLAVVGLAVNAERGPRMAGPRVLLRGRLRRHHPRDRPLVLRLAAPNRSPPASGPRRRGERGRIAALLVAAARHLPRLRRCSDSPTTRCRSARRSTSGRSWATRRTPSRPSVGPGRPASSSRPPPSTARSRTVWPVICSPPASTSSSRPRSVTSPPVACRCVRSGAFRCSTWSRCRAMAGAHWRSGPSTSASRRRRCWSRRPSSSWRPSRSSSTAGGPCSSGRSGSGRTASASGA